MLSFNKDLTVDRHQPLPLKPASSDNASTLKSILKVSSSVLESSSVQATSQKKVRFATNHTIYSEGQQPVTDKLKTTFLREKDTEENLNKRKKQCLTEILELTDQLALLESAAAGPDQEKTTGTFAGLRITNQLLRLKEVKLSSLQRRLDLLEEQMS